MSFKFLEGYDVLGTENLILQILIKDPGDEKEIPYYWYQIRLKDSLEPIGKISIRIGHNYHSYYNGHIGAEIDEKYRGHNYSLEASLALLRVARAHGMTYIYVTCDVENISSYTLIEKAGGKLVEVTKMPKDFFGYYEGIPDHRIYKVDITKI